MISEKTSVSVLLLHASSHRSLNHCIVLAKRKLKCCRNLDRASTIDVGCRSRIPTVYMRRLAYIKHVSAFLQPTLC